MNFVSISIEQSMVKHSSPPKTEQIERRLCAIEHAVLARREVCSFAAVNSEQAAMRTQFRNLANGQRIKPSKCV